MFFRNALIHEDDIGIFGRADHMRLLVERQSGAAMQAIQDS